MYVLLYNYHKDIYKVFFNKEPHFFKSSLYEYEMLGAENPHFKKL